VEEPHQVGVEGDLRNFGFNINPIILERIYGRITREKPRDSIANQMAAMEYYELEMGIQKGDGSEVPISLVTMKPWRDFVKDSDWERTVKVLMKYKLHTSTGLNITQLLDLPRHQLRMLIDCASEVAKGEPAIIADMEAAAKKAGKDRANNSNK